MKNRDRSALFFFSPLFPFSAGRSIAPRNIMDELFVLVADSLALQWRVTTKEEKRFTLAINNNESTRSACLVTDIPHFSHFISLAPLPLSLFRAYLSPAEVRQWRMMNANVWKRQPRSSCRKLIRNSSLLCIDITICTCTWHSRNFSFLLFTTYYWPRFYIHCICSMCVCVSIYLYILYAYNIFMIFRDKIYCGVSRWL